MCTSQTRPEAGFHLAGYFQFVFPPPVSDRLAELQRQRALAQEQLAWFDREIAREGGQAPTPFTPGPTPAIIPPAPAPSPDQLAREVATARAAEDIIAQFQQAPGDAAKNTKRGCYLWFAFVMMTVVLVAAGIYWIYRNR
jgi:hypothetical protein